MNMSNISEEFYCTDAQSSMPRIRSLKHNANATHLVVQSALCSNQLKTFDMVPYLVRQANCVLRKCCCLPPQMSTRGSRCLSAVCWGFIGIIGSIHHSPDWSLIDNRHIEEGDYFSAPSALIFGVSTISVTSIFIPCYCLYSERLFDFASLVVVRMFCAKVLFGTKYWFMRPTSMRGEISRKDDRSGRMRGDKTPMRGKTPTPWAFHLSLGARRPKRIVWKNDDTSETVLGRSISLLSSQHQLPYYPSPLRRCLL